MGKTLGRRLNISVTSPDEITVRSTIFAGSIFILTHLARTKWPQFRRRQFHIRLPE